MGRATFGSIRKRGHRYQARYTDPAGVMRTLGTFATKGEAATALSRVSVAAADGVWRSPEETSQPVGKYIEAWLERRIARRTMKPATIALYRENLDGYVNKPQPLRGNPRFILGQIPMSALNPNLIEDWVIAVREGIRARKAIAPVKRLSDEAAARAWAKSTGRKVAVSGRLASAVIAEWRIAGAPQPPAQDREVGDRVGQEKAWQAYAMLRAVCNDAVRNDVLVKTPCRLVKADVCPALEREVVPATVAQIQALTDAAPAHYAAAIQLAAFGGLRIGEVRALRRSDITILTDDHGQVTGSIVEVMRGISDGVETTPKTRAGTRTVALPIQAARYLAGHLAHFTDPDPAARVFDRLYMNAVWYRALKAAGLEGFRFHDLRHTFASLSVASGVEARAVQAALGHATASMTALYTHATPDYAARVAAGLNAVLEADSPLRD